MKRIATLAAGITIVAASYTIYIPPEGAGQTAEQPVILAKSKSAAQVAAGISSSDASRGVAVSTKLEAQENVLEKVDTPIYLDGKRVNLSKPSVIKNGSTLVPLRSVFEPMGITVKWDADNATVLAEKAGTHLTMKPGENTAKLNDKNVSLQAAGQINDESMYVPLRFVGESFNALIGYDNLTRTISISTKPYLKGKVTYLADGDTMDVLFQNGDTRRIRLIGVNTPESTKAAGIEPGGKAASAYSKSRLLGQNVFVTRDKTDDPYGRMLAYIHLESGEFYNATLASEGYARVMTIEPNTTWRTYFEDLQRAAQKEKRRLWSPDMYANLEPEVAGSMVKELAEAGIVKTSSQLAAPMTEGEFSKLLLLTLFPQARLLMTGYKVYEISKDENTQQIIQALKNKESSTELFNNEQLHSLILLSLGLEEGSLAAKTLDNLGLIPSLDRPVTVGEAAGIVQDVKSFLPSIQELKQKAKTIKPDIKEGIDGAVGELSDLNLADKSKDAGGWIKDTASGLLKKAPANGEGKQGEERK
ncbi:stalk domain-containing protein [Paenibacillus cremeus]|uniref:TNase-like domain-containing protein n=1 Tax=Paenibacillus cremeus TaxID=2163881 RepID=A0A559K344_9BACL|nr:stalk domain-containing protein [Paenibacillus cremeus]TVY06573.1 hypothetical protein FPZ49_28670 [Paenibacillus cremeus]